MTALRPRGAITGKIGQISTFLYNSAQTPEEYHIWRWFFTHVILEFAYFCKIAYSDYDYLTRPCSGGVICSMSSERK